MIAAQKEASEGTPFGAIDVLSKLTDKEPGNAIAWRWRAFSEQQMGDAKSALASLNHAIDIDPCDHDTLMQRAVLESRTGAIREAYDHLSALITTDPKDAPAHQMRGDILLNSEENAAALADYDAALADGEPNIELLLNRGGALQEIGRFEEAEADYAQGLQMEPDNIELLAARGYTRFFRQNFQGAADDLRPVAKVDDNALAWLFLAESRLGAAQAADDLKQGAAQRSSDNWIQAVASHFRDNTSDDDLLKTASSAVMRCSALFYVGEIHLAKGEKDKAKQSFLRAADECPIDPQRFSGSLREYVGATEELKRLN
jgi:tetratricopeptide (TPR) repeat protein